MPEHVYSFDYSNVHVAVLTTEMTYAQFTSSDKTIKNNANALLDNQIKWLKEDVKASNKKWNIVVLHKGLYSSGSHNVDSDVLIMREKLAPVFDELSIDAVLQGHNHVFDKAFLYNGKTVEGLNSKSVEINKTKGTLYLTNNSAGPKFYDLTKSAKYPYLLKFAQPCKQMYTGISATNGALKFETYTVTDNPTDELFDTFTIYK